MSTFVVSRFNPETDPDRPVVGTKIDLGDQTVTIVEVGWSPTSAVIAEQLAGVTESVVMDPKGHTICLARAHTTRPGVTWLAWGDV